MSVLHAHLRAWHIAVLEDGDVICETILALTTDGIICSGYGHYIWGGTKTLAERKRVKTQCAGR